MTILLKSVTIYDATSSLHKETRDILIENGIISKINQNITHDTAKTIEAQDLCVSPGWLDSSVCFGEPGYEERETIANGLKTAALSGFSEVILNTNTNPIPDHSTSINFVLQKSAGNAVSTYALGALTEKSDTAHLAELYDMKQAGAVGFYDYQKPISNPNLLKIALQYAQGFDSLVYSFPLDKNIAGKGVANEEVNATKLGLKGIPALSENLQIARDLFVLEYTGGKLHIPTISTKEAVTIIAEAKAKGLDVSCSVSIAHLFFTDDALQEFNTNFKLMPPLRTEEDRLALIEGVKNGTINFVVSDHNPLDEELKKVDFDHASYGCIGLESFFGAMCTIFEIEEVIAILTRNKERYQITSRSIEEGSQANLSLFFHSKMEIFNKKDLRSKSKNSPFIGKTLKGKPFGIINNNQLITQ